VAAAAYASGIRKMFDTKRTGSGGFGSA